MRSDFIKEQLDFLVMPIENSYFTLNSSKIGSAQSETVAQILFNVSGNAKMQL